MLEIKENFLSVDLIEYLCLYCKKLPHYYGHSSLGNDNYFYNHEFDLNNPLINFLWYKISKLKNHNSTLLRCYVNIQFKEMNGDFHTDDGDQTILLMVSETLKNNDGSFDIIINNETKKISFVQNRLIIFSSSFLHKGNAPEFSKGPRMTIAFKTKFK